jgi:hypothetical protein
MTPPWRFASTHFFCKVVTFASLSGLFYLQNIGASLPALPTFLWWVTLSRETAMYKRASSAWWVVGVGIGLLIMGIWLAGQTMKRSRRTGNVDPAYRARQAHR